MYKLCIYKYTHFCPVGNHPGTLKVTQSVNIKGISLTKSVYIVYNIICYVSCVHGISCFLKCPIPYIFPDTWYCTEIYTISHYCIIIMYSYITRS